MTAIALIMILDFFVTDIAALAWIKQSALVMRSWGIVIAAFAMALVPTFCADTLGRL